MPAGMMLRSPRIASSISDPAGLISTASPRPPACPSVRRCRWKRLSSTGDGSRPRRCPRWIVAGSSRCSGPRAASCSPWPTVNESPRSWSSSPPASPPSRTYRAPSAACRRSSLRTHRSTATSAALRTAGARRRLWAERAGVGRVAARAWRRGGYRRAGPGRAVAEPASPAARARSGVHAAVRPTRGWAAAQSAGPGAGLVHRMPSRSRHAVDRRSIRPAGAGWLKPRIDGKVTIHNGSS